MSGSVVFNTSMGKITFELYWDHAPKTCENFYELCKVVIQPEPVEEAHQSTGEVIVRFSGVPIMFDLIINQNREKFEDEINPELKHTGAGILSMANSGPNTNGSQLAMAKPHHVGRYIWFGSSPAVSFVYTGSKLLLKTKNYFGPKLLSCPGNDYRAIFVMDVVNAKTHGNVFIVGAEEAILPKYLIIYNVKFKSNEKFC
ncbi:4326_t:CDS:2 [Acaulospora colombiana]|uniref:4326_t:CDS:1 n=1 Tax=Acaulospora colombiana TaxID=27376 RepID=A0ACA9LND6_9GLOM|nr:4326_t:CDS:2 [Acaulospora colombiana]